MTLLLISKITFALGIAFACAAVLAFADARAFRETLDDTSDDGADWSLEDRFSHGSDNMTGAQRDHG